MPKNNFLLVLSFFVISFPHLYSFSSIYVEEQYAIKKLEQRFATLDALLATTECQTIRRLHNVSPYLVRFFDIIRENDSTVYYVMERMDFDLLTYINQLKQEQQQQQHDRSAAEGMVMMGVDPVTFRSILWQALHGLAAIHGLNYVHRDVKPENILLQRRRNGQSFNVRVADFSLARPIAVRQQRPQVVVDHHDGTQNFVDESSAESCMTGYVASRWYRSPELLLQMSYGQPVDMWALGCVACEMCQLDAIFQGETDLEQFKIICNFFDSVNLNMDWPEAIGPTERLTCNVSTLSQVTPMIEVGVDGDDASGNDRGLTVNVDSGTKNFIGKILRLNPSKRITASQALEDDYFKSSSVGNTANNIPSHAHQFARTFQSPPSLQPLQQQQYQRQQLSTSSRMPADVSVSPSSNRTYGSSYRSHRHDTDGGYHVPFSDTRVLFEMAFLDDDCSP
jgi:serine/threonine protein kinase